MKHTTKGFTIVELLVAIVVIAILATISIAVFGGLQERARNAKTINAFNTYHKVFTEFAIIESRYPNLSGEGVPNAGSCLGSEYPGDVCWGTGGAQKSENATLMNTLGSFIVNKPMPGLVSSVGAGQYRGILYIPAAAGWRLDGVARDWLLYAIEGSSNECEVGDVASHVSGVNFSSTPPANGTTTNTGGTPTCWVPLPAL